MNSSPDKVMPSARRPPPAARQGVSTKIKTSRNTGVSKQDHLYIYDIYDTSVVTAMECWIWVKNIYELEWPIQRIGQKIL